MALGAQTALSASLQKFISESRRENRRGEEGREAGRELEQPLLRDGEGGVVLHRIFEEYISGKKKSFNNVCIYESG